MATKHGGMRGPACVHTCACVCLGERVCRATASLKPQPDATLCGLGPEGCGHQHSQRPRPQHREMIRRGQPAVFKFLGDFEAGPLHRYLISMQETMEKTMVVVNIYLYQNGNN